MDIGEIKKLQAERRWLQLCSAVVASIDRCPATQLLELFMQSAANIHPKSSSEVFLALSERLSPEEAIGMLATGQDILDNAVLYSGAFENEKALLEIRRCLLLVELDRVKGVEKKLFEWKGLKMCRRMQAMYNLLGFRLYEKMQNIESAFAYLLQYVELCPDADVMDVLVQYALLSKDFFNFTSVASLPGFEAMKSKSLRMLLLLFRDGDIKGLEECDGTFVETFGDCSEVVREKIYMTALLNLCFAEPEKSIRLDVIESALHISPKICVYMVLKSFGLGLIKGWIDGEAQMLHFSSLLPRSLQPEELSRIRDKFDAWRQRVCEVVSMLK